MIIYKVQNKIDGKIYIGQTKHKLKDRMYDHIRIPDCRIFHNALMKYGVENFDISIIDEAKTRREINEKEVHWIKLFNCKSPNGYNLNDGGNGCDPSEETRKRISEIGRGRKRPPISEETRRKMSESGKKKESPSKETREKLRKTSIGRIHSIETKKRIGEANLGERNATKRPEVKEKMSKSHRGKYASEETKKKMKEARARFLALESWRII